MKLDDPEKSLQFHTGAGGATGDRPAVFHGQGTGKDDKLEKKQILRFFQMFNNGVMESLAKENDPLILIGVKYLIPIYREANSYSHLHGEAVDINPQELKPKEIHSKAWEKIETIFKESETEAINEYGNKSSDELTSTNIEEVVKAAVNQRIDKLFINADKQIWGKFDNKSDKLEIDEKPTVENEDLQDFAIIHTIENNGVVYTLENDRMINHNSMAAIFRYPTA